MVGHDSCVSMSMCFFDVHNGQFSHHLHLECLEKIGYPDDGQVLTSFQTPLQHAGVELFLWNVVSQLIADSLDLRV